MTPKPSSCPESERMNGEKSGRERPTETEWSGAKSPRCIKLGKFTQNAKRKCKTSLLGAGDAAAQW